MMFQITSKQHADQIKAMQDKIDQDANSTTTTELNPDGTKKTSADFDQTTTFELMEEFASGIASTSGQIGTYGWLLGYSGGGGSSLSLGLESNEIGHLRIYGASTSTVYVSLGYGIVNGSQANLTWIARVKNVQAAQDGAVRRIGFETAQTASGDPTNGIFFRATNLGNWYAVTRSGGAETATDSGVAQSTTFHQFKILQNSVGTSVTFYIDGVLKATHTTNIPYLALISPEFQIEMTGIDAGMDVGYSYMKVTGLSR